MESRGRAKLAVSQGVSVWLLEALQGFGEPDVHAHHAIQITVRFHGRLALTADGVTVSGEVIAVAPDVRHRLDAEGLIGFVFVEPESPTGQLLSRRLFGERGLVLLDEEEFVRRIAPLRDAFDAPLSSERMLDLGSTALAALAPAEPSNATDARILSIIEHVAANLDQPTSLNRAAEAAGVYLSESRLRHLFVEQTGLAFKTYLLWLKLVRAVRLYAEGHSLTAAAHSAGFADSAHFSRVFKRTFGAPATNLTRL